MSAAAQNASRYEEGEGVCERTLTVSHRPYHTGLFLKHYVPQTLQTLYLSANWVSDTGRKSPPSVETTSKRPVAAS